MCLMTVPCNFNREFNKQVANCVHHSVSLQIPTNVKILDIAINMTAEEQLRSESDRIHYKFHSLRNLVIFILLRKLRLKYSYPSVNAPRHENIWNNGSKIPRSLTSTLEESKRPVSRSGRHPLDTSLTEFKRRF
jgi:hypothetical protein